MKQDPAAIVAALYLLLPLVLRLRPPALPTQSHFCGSHE